jgi:hypothetical protein
MNYIEFEQVDPAVKGGSVNKRLVDGWMLLHCYNVKVLIGKVSIDVYSEEVFFAMGKPKQVQRFLDVKTSE